MHGEITERFLARKKFFRQRRPLVGELLLLGTQSDVPVEAFLAQCFRGLGTAKSATDDDECGRVGHDRCSLLLSCAQSGGADRHRAMPAPTRRPDGHWRAGRAYLALSG